MRILKFSFMWQHQKTGEWLDKRYDLIEIISGYPYDDMSDNPMLRDYHHKATRQFTGLTDKNGVEIYEGDIIRWGGTVIGVVSFAHCEFIIGSGVDARAMCALRDGQAEEELEVISNVHQNPELLK